MGTRALTLVGLVALVALAFVLARERAPRGDAARPEAPPASAGTADEPAPGPLASAVAPPPIPAARSALAPVDPAPASRSPAGETLVLEVLDGRSSTPAADVEVRFLTGARLPRSRCLAHQPAAGTASARTDAHGIARLALPHSQAVAVLARAPGLLGEAAFAPRAPDERGERRGRVVLQPDWPLLVEVVDDAGRPAAGVPVSVGFAGATTGADGRATIAGVGHELSPGARPLQVRAVLPLLPEVSALVEREPPAGEPVRLRLPPLGALEVEVLAASGVAVPDGTRVALQVLGRGVRGSDTTQGGRVLFEHVPLGCELELSAERVPERGRLRTPGPRAPGERITAMLRLSTEDTLLVFRALDGAGQAVVASLSARVRTGTARSSGSSETTVDTDARGYFEVRLESALAEGDRRELEVHEPERGLAARVDLARPFPPGRIDMGDLVLAPAPVVAEGRVLDQDGRGAGGARVSWSPVAGPEGTSAFDVPAAGLQATDEDGAFVLRGFTTAARVRLEAHHESLRGEPLEVPTGARGVVLGVRGTGALAGRVLLAPGVPWSYAIGLRENGAEAPLGSLQTKRRADGHFECRRVPAGTYAFTLVSGSETLLEVPDVVVRAGETARDPRLQALDLRGRLRVHRLELVRPAPDFRIAGTLSYGPAGADAAQHSLVLRNSDEIVLSTPFARLDATLQVAGCRVERFPDLPEHARVTLRPGLPVRLVLPPGVAPPAAPLHLGVELGSGREGRCFDEHGELLLHAPEPGRLALRWFVERRHAGGGGRSVVELPTPLFVEVEERPDEQRFELALTAAELSAALRER